MSPLLKEAKCHLTYHTDCTNTAEALVTDITLNLSVLTFLGFFSMPLGIGPNNKRTTILSSHSSHIIFAGTWDQTRTLCGPRLVCYPLGHILQQMRSSPEHMPFCDIITRTGEVYCVICIIEPQYTNDI